MSLRAATVGAGAVLVLGSGVYLFHAVREAPAQARVAGVTPPRVAPVIAVADPEPPPPTPDVPPTTLGHRDRIPPPSAPSPSPAPPAPEVDEQRPGSDDPTRAHPKADSIMDQANKAYDNGELDDATALATKVLATDPTNVRMLRIMVSVACMGGDGATAQKFYSVLKPVDRNMMKIRCERYGIAFVE